MTGRGAPDTELLSVSRTNIVLESLNLAATASVACDSMSSASEKT